MPAPRRFTEVAAALAAAALPRVVGPARTGWYAEDEIVDTPVYAAYGKAIEDGAVPYRDFRPEYPPGALLAFALPALVSDDEDGFRDAFEWLMAVCGVACVLLVAVDAAGLGASRVRTAAALAFVPSFPLLLGSVVLTRFDLLPAALVAARSPRSWGARPARLRAARGGGRREALPGRAPAARGRVGLAPPRAARGVVCLAVWPPSWSLAFLPFLVVAPGGVAHSIGHQLSRPLQIESLGSALYLAAHHLVGLDVEMRSATARRTSTRPGTGVAAVLSRSRCSPCCSGSGCVARRNGARSSCAGVLPRSSPSSRSARCSRRSS